MFAAIITTYVTGALVSCGAVSYFATEANENLEDQQWPIVLFWPLIIPVMVPIYIGKSLAKKKQERKKLADAEIIRRRGLELEGMLEVEKFLAGSK